MRQQHIPVTFDFWAILENSEKMLKWDETTKRTNLLSVKKSKE